MKKLLNLKAVNVCGFCSLFDFWAMCIYQNGNFTCNSEFSVLCKSFSSVKLLGYDVVFSVFANEKDNLKFIEFFAYFRVQSTNSNASNLHGVSNEHSL